MPALRKGSGIKREKRLPKNLGATGAAKKTARRGNRGRAVVD